MMMMVSVVVPYKRRFKPRTIPAIIQTSRVNFSSRITAPILPPPPSSYSSPSSSSVSFSSPTKEIARMQSSSIDNNGDISNTTTLFEKLRLAKDQMRDVGGENSSSDMRKLKTTTNTLVKVVNYDEKDGYHYISSLHQMWGRITMFSNDSFREPSVTSSIQIHSCLLSS